MTKEKSQNKGFLPNDGAINKSLSGDKLNTHIETGCYNIEISHSDAVEVGLPIEVCGIDHYIKGYLFISELGTQGPLQKERTIGQTLLINACGSTTPDVYRRSGGFSKGVISWGKWTRVLDYETFATIFNDYKDEMLHAIVWDETSSIDEYTSSGVFDITGERVNSEDGFPIETAADGHNLHARLVVLDSSIDGVGNDNDKCVTQILTLSNRVIGGGDVYIRTGRASTKNILASGSGWEQWGKLQQNVQVGQVTSLNSYTGNGIYSGVYTDGSSFFETFVLVVIDNRSVAEATGVVRSISQFKYALGADGLFSHKTRSGQGESNISWGEWVDLGASTTTDFQDNSVTMRKLGLDVRDKLERIEPLEENTEALNEVVQLNRIALDASLGRRISAGELRNGTLASYSNASCVAMRTVMPVNGAEYAMCITDRPNSENCVYRYINNLYIVDSGATAYPGPIQNVKYDTADSEHWNIIRCGGYKGVGFGITEYNTVTGEISPLQIGDFNGYGLYVYLYDKNSLVHHAIRNQGAYQRNLDKEPALVNACRLYATSSSSKDMQVLVLSDSHADAIAENNAVGASNGFKTIDCIFHCGDFIESYFKKNEADNYNKRMSMCAKPYFTVIGNHDVGNSYSIGACCNHNEAYEQIIQPMVTAGTLIEGEYTVGKPYYYHDFNNYKIRLIVPYDYDSSLDLDETYWKAIEYDSTLPTLALSTQYKVGDCVNALMKNGLTYTEHSFECVQDVKTPSEIYDNNLRLPSYKSMRGVRVIRQEQAQWFLDTLCNTPKDYSVVVLVHNPFSMNVSTVSDAKFCQKGNHIAGAIATNNMVTDFIANAIEAFNNGSNYTEKVVFNGSSIFLNTQTDGDGNAYSYEVSKDFSAKQSGAKFLCYIGGHTHMDIIWKHNTYNQYQVSVATCNMSYAQCYKSDIKRNSLGGNRTTDGDVSRDSFTAVSFDNDNSAVRLVKIGGTVTMDMELRDFEKLSLL
ncbi:MAG: metallophosphoesterase [Bacteroidaceae bacterium]|nr:metallophosphoesterase [Bacteroidaceae bacterium]